MLRDTTTRAPASDAQPPAAANLDAVKARQQATWSDGDYAVIGTTLQIVGESLCEAVDIRSVVRVLDVATGNGNAALAAARRWCEVTASDYVPALLERARERAVADRLPIEFRTADAEKLPFPDASYDVVLSTFGVMFTPDQQRAASEMARVCRPGGKIGLANWTPESFIGQLFKAIGKHIPPPPGLRPPALWGTEVRLAELFGESAASIDLQRRNFVFRYRSPAHWLEVFRTYYGPTKRAFEALDAQGGKELEKEILALLNKGNRSGDGTLVLPSEYAEVVIVRA